MKFSLKLLLLAILVVMNIAPSFAGVDMSQINGVDQIKTISTNTVGTTGDDSMTKLQQGGLKALHTVKVIISFIAVIYIVYAGVMMVVAMGGEKEVATERKQLYHAVLAFLFVNIPGDLYALFAQKKVQNATENAASNYTDVNKAWTNMFVSFVNWGDTIGTGVIGFMKIALIGAAVFMFTLAAIQLITSAWDEEKLKHAKTKFLYGTLGLVFVAVIQGWVQVVYKGDIGWGQGILSQLSNLALFFAGPVAIFFLLLAGYYILTSAWDEEKVKKGKTIIVNTFIAVIILLASYTFLKDLADFNLPSVTQ